MKQFFGLQKTVAGAILAMGTVGLMSGCATKKYVKTTVDTTAQGLSARMDTQEQGIKANSSQVEELNSVTRQQNQKLGELDNGLKQADTKAQEALGKGESAQSSARKANEQVSALDSKFQNRNHYVVLNQEQVQFKFNSAKLENSFKQVLDDLARQLKENPDAILVMEGHTDAAGSDDYNIQLGQKRVDAVMRYLVVEQEVPVHRISQMSFGKAKPVSTEKSRTARAQNRAVVVRLMGPQLDNAKDGSVSQAMPESQPQARPEAQ